MSKDVFHDPKLRDSKRRESGFLTIWMLGLCVSLFMLGGIALDLWRGFSDRRQLAGMADAAAVAAASQIDLNAFKLNTKPLKLDPVAAPQRAIQYMNDAATQAGMTLTSVNANVIPRTANGQDDQVVVTATTRYNLSLTRVLLQADPVPISVSSTATPQQAQ